MSDVIEKEGEGSEAVVEQKDDGIKSVKAELEAQNQKMEAILSHLQTFKQPEKEQPAKNSKAPDPLEDPEAFAAYVAEKATHVATKKSDTQTAINMTVAKIQREFPEFQDDNSEETKAVLAEYGRLPAHLKNTAEGAELAMNRVIANRGLQPLTKRQKSEREKEEFSLSGSGNGNQRRPNKTEKTEVDPMTLEWSKLLGRNTDDPEYKKRIEQASKRDYKRYQK